jgi:hypothetical protein
MPAQHVEESVDGLVLVDDQGQRRRAYLMKEALDLAGISESTFYRWVRGRRIPDVSLRNRSDWRIFTDGDIERLKIEAIRVRGR